MSETGTCEKCGRPLPLVELPELTPEKQAALDARKARRDAEAGARMDARIETARG